VGEPLAAERRIRAAAFPREKSLRAFDYDANGSLDLLVTEANGTPHLYRNDRPADRGWLTIRLDDPTRPGNRQGLGSKVVVTQENGRRTTMWVSTDGSYESQKPAELHVGLGDRPRPVRVEVWWPGASRPQRIDDVAPRQILTIERAR